MSDEAQRRRRFIWRNCVARLGVPIGIASSILQLAKRGYRESDLLSGEVVGLVLVTVLGAAFIAYLVGAYLWSRQKHMRHYFEL